MKKVMIGLLLCSLVITILSGCRVNISIGTNDTLTSETYPDAEKYQIGSFTYNAAGIKAVGVPVKWRSQNRIIQSFTSRKAAANCRRIPPCTTFWMTVC